MGCFVYVAVAGDSVKIGLSDKPEKRLRQLATGSPEPLRLHHTWRLSCRAKAEALERQLHHAFRRERLRREWFSAEPEHVVGVGDGLLAGGQPEAVRRLRIYRQASAFNANWLRRRDTGAPAHRVERSFLLLREAMRRLVRAGLSRNEWDEVFLD